MAHPMPQTPPEQISYGGLLFYGAWCSLALLLTTYLIYLTGFLDNYVPIQQLPHYWSKPVGEYVHEANIPLGWGWVHLLSKGDFLNFVGIALLGGMTIICFLTLLPHYIRERDIPFVVIVILEILVLALGASGLLGAGGH